MAFSFKKALFDFEGKPLLPGIRTLFRAKEKKFSFRI